MLALYSGGMRHLYFEHGRHVIEKLRTLPKAVQSRLGYDESVWEVTKKYHKASKFLYLGRQFKFLKTREGALKRRENNYIDAVRYPAAEMKRGLIALVNNAPPSVFIIPQGTTYRKVMANMEEVKVRGVLVMEITSHDDSQVDKIPDDVIQIPRSQNFYNRSRPSCHCGDCLITLHCFVAAT